MLILVQAEGLPAGMPVVVATAGMPVVVATAGTQVAEAVPTTITCVGSRQPRGVPDAALEVLWLSSCAEITQSADWLQRSSCLPPACCCISIFLRVHYCLPGAVGRVHLRRSLL